MSSHRTSVGPTRPKKRAGRDENTFSLCHRFHSLFISFILITAISQAPSPQPKKEKGRRKCGLKPKKREGKGDEFLLQNGKQVQRGNAEKNVYFLFQVNLKTPDATVETEEQYRTKVGNLKLVTEIKFSSNQGGDQDQDPGGVEVLHR